MFVDHVFFETALQSEGSIADITTKFSGYTALKLQMRTQIFPILVTSIAIGAWKIIAHINVHR